MRAKRREFSPSQRAEIYARDRAICVFSGKSLWHLDYGACPLSESNWIDHVKPSRRGGRAKLANGVCASYTYNLKKRANGADNFFWLDPESEGKPSEAYFYYFGAIQPHLASQLKRLSAIKPMDWFFNQAVSRLMWVCDATANRSGHERTPTKWAHSAAGMLKQFRDKGGTAASLKKRGLVLHPKQEDVQILLSMISEISAREYRRKVKRLKEIYLANHRAMQRFWAEDTATGLWREHRKASKNPDISPAVLDAMKSFAEFWQSDPRKLK